MLLSLSVCVYASNIVQRPVMAPDGAVDGVRWYSAGDARHYVVGRMPRRICNALLFSNSTVYDLE
jgi:hypothetical protein